MNNKTTGKETNGLLPVAGLGLAGRSCLPQLLVVDNCAKERQALGAQLSGKYRLAFADGGDKAFSKLKKTEMTHLILAGLETDNKNPKGSFAQRLSGDEAFSHIPVLFVAGGAAGDSGLESLWARDFIHKPFTPEMLHTKIRNLLIAVNLRMEEMLNGVMGELADMEGIVAGRTEKYLALLELTEKEAEILGCLNTGMSRGLAAKKTGMHSPTGLAIVGQMEKLATHNRLAVIERLGNKAWERGNPL